MTAEEGTGTTEERTGITEEGAWTTKEGTETTEEKTGTNEEASENTEEGTGTKRKEQGYSTHLKRGKKHCEKEEGSRRITGFFLGQGGKRFVWPVYLPEIV